MEEGQCGVFVYLLILKICEVSLMDPLVCISL